MSRFLFSLRNDQIAFTANFNEEGCNWQGFEGAFLDADNQAWNGVEIHVFNSSGVDLFVESGTSPMYGPGGWEVKVSETVSQETYFIEVLSEDRGKLSESISVTFPGHCDGNLAVISFEENLFRN